MTSAGNPENTVLTNPTPSHVTHRGRTQPPVTTESATEPLFLQFLSVDAPCFASVQVMA
jgi:hypothetical protein